MSDEHVLVMVPLTCGQLAGLAADKVQVGPLPGFRPNAGLAETFGVAPGEEAEAAALQVADVAGLAMGCCLADMPPLIPGMGEPIGLRQVAVARVPATSVTEIDEDGNGAVTISYLAPDEVRAFFTSRCKAALARAAQGLSLDEAWALPAVQTMLSENPLAWHDGSELPTWPAGE